ncbi:transposase [Streptomyces rishiriensis]|uniref:transposase n=1 Tax=Streptomyces rishiriensis TaxID=68264 RepID=UPI000D591A82|nr:transposase [Streptomyces rishiriensis]
MNFTFIQVGLESGSFLAVWLIRKSSPGRPRRRPDSLLGDKAYDSKAVRHELRRRRILRVISRKGAPSIKGLGKLRYVVEQTFALLHQFKRLAVRWERRTELHDASSHWPVASSAGGG